MYIYALQKRRKMAQKYMHGIMERDVSLFG